MPQLLVVSRHVWILRLAHVAVVAGQVAVVVRTWIRTIAPVECRVSIPAEAVAYTRGQFVLLIDLPVVLQLDDRLMIRADTCIAQVTALEAYIRIVKV